jgi:hypothetical protein
MAANSQTQRFTQVLEKVKSVGDLCCIRSPAAGTFRIYAGTIARDHLDAWVASQPRRDRIGISVRQKINDAIAFQIADDGPVAQPLAPGPVVDADYTRRSWRTNAAARIIRSSVSPLAGMASLRDRRAPGSPRPQSRSPVGFR